MAGNLIELKEQEAKGGSLDAQHPRTHGWNPLMAAIFHQQTNIIQYLLTRNVKLNAQDSSGETALMWAIECEDTNTVRLLLEKGAAIRVGPNDAIDWANAGGMSKQEKNVVLKWLNEYKDKNKSSAKP